MAETMQTWTCRHFWHYGRAWPEHCPDCLKLQKQSRELSIIRPTKQQRFITKQSRLTKLAAGFGKCKTKTGFVMHVPNVLTKLMAEYAKCMLAQTTKIDQRIHSSGSPVAIQTLYFQDFKVQILCALTRAGLKIYFKPTFQDTRFLRP